MPVGPQSHPDETRTGIDSSHRRRSVEPVLMDTYEVAAMRDMPTSWAYREASELGPSAPTVHGFLNSELHVLSCAC
ncbi:hypothetical protein GCM10022285_27330 [Streptomyces tunisiensis]|uniref:Uncharacterized protein n=1 Tax=Streptomyces tunisiensis TaxID=948699 RepID=A0ABP7YFM4_9ACTN